MTVTRDVHARLISGLRAGLSKGWSGFVWMLKILVPISFLAFLLDYSGGLRQLDGLFSPLMSLLHLPPAAAFPLLVGMLTGIYGGIAAMTALPFTNSEMTLMAIFLLISHNLIQEGAIQGKSGLHPLKATLFRLATSSVTVWAVAPFLGADTGGATAPPVSGLPQSAALIPALGAWTMATLGLMVKILLIIMVLMVLLECLKHLALIDPLVGILRPLLRMMGLERNVGLLWLTAVLFGLAYGAAVIVQEARDGRFKPKELERLHLSIGINHSMVEDPALFLSLGLSAFWLWVPRLVIAVAAVRLYDVWQLAVNRGSTSGSTSDPG
jgi:hypothetical protein